jgi:hypothetical protein
MSFGLDETMTVYTEDPTTGLYTVVDASGVRCRLFHEARQPAATGLDRAELGAIRNLHYDPSYTLPDGAQILSGGQRWNCLHGTDGKVRLFGDSIQKRIDVKRAD